LSDLHWNYHGNRIFYKIVPVTIFEGSKNREVMMLMKKNMGVIDRVIRAIVAVAIGVFYFAGMITGVAAVVLGVFAVILLLTSATGVCPLYGPFGITTCPRNDCKT
jgi:hypothetical protein